MRLTKHQVNVAKITAITIIFFCLCSYSPAQVNLPGDSLSSDKKPFSTAPAMLYVRSIIINGNKRTKDYIIVREMIIKAGDSVLISKLNELIERSRQYIYNTTLFVEVKAEPLVISAADIDVVISVKERWYVFPIPQFSLVDRSFNEWIVKYKGTLKRVNYGMKFVHYNLSGRNDKLRLYIINGYTRNISASYSAPYSNAKLTEGFAVAAGYSQTKEIAYKTNYDNSLAFYNDGGFVRDSWNVNGSYTKRKAIKKREILSAGFTHLQISDSIISQKFNPKYFNSNSSTQNVVDISYSLIYVDVNNILYPLSGFTGFFGIQKRGLGLTGGINMLSIEGDYNKYYDLGKKWYGNLQLTGKIKLPFKQPYINLRALGDRSNYLRGLEYFNIDGVAYATTKFTLKREILNFKVPTFFKSKTYSKIPFRIFAKAYTDFGYVYTEERPLTRLNNTLLYTGGVGLDILTLYDIQIRMEFSVNQLRQKQLFFHTTPGGY